MSTARGRRIADAIAKRIMANQNRLRWAGLHQSALDEVSTMSEVHSTPDSNPTRGQSQREAAGFNQNDSPVVSQVQVSIPAPQRGVDRTVSQEAQDTNVNPTGKQPEGTL